MNEQIVLFLCTGNFYRSRYAEALFNHHAALAGLNWKARSKGFRPHLATEDLSHWAAERLEEHHIPFSLTRAKPGKLCPLDLAESSLVIALYEPEHAPMVKEQFPQWIDRIRYWHVPDIDITTPAIALAKIEYEIDDLIRQLAAGHALGRHEDCVVEF
ncbi:MAG: low molecular weight phosphatase family protein [Verrucomicrobiales bacterium]|nr:low molecular weight phosphatase family protein [Verrucomicrobiales bacterium]